MVNALRETGQLDNTLIVFTSDNGGERFSDNWPLVGGKMDLTEGGIRVPWIAHWPEGISKPGSTTAQHCMTMDWSATLVDIGGGKAHVDYPFDGVSLKPLLANPDATFERPLYWRMNHRGQRALRSGDWKYLRVDGNDYLFNVVADARERANLAKQEPERLQVDEGGMGALAQHHATHSRRRHHQPWLFCERHAAALKLQAACSFTMGASLMGKLIRAAMADKAMSAHHIHW